MTAKPRGKPFAKGEDPRRKIAPNENVVSLTRIAKRFLDMTPHAISTEIEILRKRYATLGRGESSMAEIIVASFLYAVANDPQPGNMRELWRRIDGEVVQPTFDIDVTKLSNEDLERLRNGESIKTILANAGRCGTGIPQKATGAREPAPDVDSETVTNPT
jgi:hypothetical protein